MNPLLVIAGKLLGSLRFRIRRAIRGRKVSAIDHARVAAAIDRARQGGKWPPLIGRELGKCNLIDQANDILRGVALGAIVISVEPVHERTVRPWAIDTVMLSARSLAVSKCVLEFSGYWGRERGKGLDLGIIAGNFICERIAEQPGATERLKHECASVQARAEIGRHISPGA